MNYKLILISTGLAFVLFGCSPMYQVFVEIQTTNNSGNSQVIGFTNSYTTIGPFTIAAADTIPISLKYDKHGESEIVTTKIQVFDDITSPVEIASGLFTDRGAGTTEVLVTIQPGLTFTILD